MEIHMNEIKKKYKLLDKKANGPRIKDKNNNQATLKKDNLT